jgi:hypothetical protein
MNIGLDQINRFLFGKLPPANVMDGYDDLYDGGLTKGTFIVGSSGRGKTESLARNLVEYSLRHPDEAIFVLDWSGPITNAMLSMYLQLPQKVRENTIKRIVYDELGHHEWVLPMPEFSTEFGDPEDQVQRVVKNLEDSHPSLKERTPVVGGLAMENATYFLRMCSAIKNEHGESWQITEVKKLLVDEALLQRAVDRYGGMVPDAKFFIERIFLDKNDRDRQLSIFALVSILGAVEPREMRARFGYYRRAWSPKEANEKGQIVFVNGANLINQEKSLSYAFAQVLSLILQEMKKRTPDNPDDKPISLVLDEAYGLIGIPGIAKQIGELPSQYRSRKLQLYLVFQSFSQLAPPLDEQIWSMGNGMFFAIDNKNESEEVAHQLFRYDPRYQKQPALTSYQNPTTEPEKGQDRLIGDWIQTLPFRQCLMRRYSTERKPDPYVILVWRTREIPNKPLAMSVYELKEMKLRERGVRVREALEIPNQRTLKPEVRRPPTA